MTDFLTIDTETGGFYPAKHALLSIGACCSWSGETFEIYITVESQPGKIVDAEAAEINGYSKEAWELLGAVAMPVAYAALLTWIEARKAERPLAVLVCHHLAFEKGFLGECERLTMKQLPHRNDWRCSQVLLGLAMDLGLVERGSSSLNNLKALSGWTQEREAKHNALQDAVITRHGYRWLLGKLH